MAEKDEIRPNRTVLGLCVGIISLRVKSGYCEIISASPARRIHPKRNTQAQEMVIVFLTLRTSDRHQSHSLFYFTP